MPTSVFVFNVLFVSRDNALRSQLAEVCLRHLGQGRFKAYSCGAPGCVAESPSDWVFPTLKTAGMRADGLRCKSWTEFTRIGAPRMDFVIGLDEGTFERHPSWPGQPETALWAIAAVDARKLGPQKTGLETLNTLHALRRRIELLVSLAARGARASELRHDLRDMAHL
jgi:arsenate reductase